VGEARQERIADSQGGAAEEGGAGQKEDDAGHEKKKGRIMRPLIVA
jgi:hypothetical protein